MLMSVGGRCAPVVLPVGEHDDERVRLAAVLVAEEGADVEGGIRFQRLRQILRHGACEAIGWYSRQRRTRARRDEDEEQTLHGQHGGQAEDEAESDSPVEAAIPTCRHTTTLP